jgi:hypothetical protein
MGISWLYNGITYIESFSTSTMSLSTLSLKKYSMGTLLARVIGHTIPLPLGLIVSLKI